jgi:sporulation protein YlmC with PRC-barrel domain
MSAPEQIDLALGVLDHQLLDSEKRRCGKVDDLELEGLGEGKPQVAAILAGAPAWRGRGRLGRVLAGLAGGRTVRIPWEEVTEIGSAVHLRKTAAELQLGRGDDRARPWVRRVPRAE